ncbi:hypothetical protein KQI63_06470 [bacterium]|nr:hypothetical protein [bacterium]
MSTNLERLQNRISFLRDEAIYLSGRDHDPSDFAALLKNAGGMLETFLKAHIHPTGRNWNFERLIDELASMGISAQGISSLHLLRRRYNAAKHDPAYDAGMDEVIEALDGAVSALSEMLGRSIGSSEHDAVSAYRRRVWLASWDHFVHGDGEVHVILPVAENDCDFPFSIDVIYLKGLAWPDVLLPLGDSIHPAQGLIPQKFLDMWEKEEDFAGARVFDGVYKDLLRALVGAELRLDLLPFLKRENDPMAMLTAIAFASVDALSEHGAFSSIEEMKNEVLAYGARDYAAPRTSPLAIKAAERFCSLLDEVPSATQSEISGPRFVSAHRFEQALAQAVAHDDGAAITDELELVLRL